MAEKFSESSQIGRTIQSRSMYVAQNVNNFTGKHSECDTVENSTGQLSALEISVQNSAKIIYN